MVTSQGIGHVSAVVVTSPAVVVTAKSNEKKQNTGLIIRERRFKTFDLTEQAAGRDQGNLGAEATRGSYPGHVAVMALLCTAPPSEDLYQDFVPLFVMYCSLCMQSSGSILLHE